MQVARRIDKFVDIRNGRTQAGVRIELTAGCENTVPEGFGIEAASIMAAEKLVFRVGIPYVGFTEAALLISAAENNAANQLFDRPAFTAEACRQVIEQFGMCGAFAVDAKIIGSANERLTEQMQPDAVHHHAGGLRMIVRGEPFCQLQATTL